jgi:hypothetical protein
LPRDERGHLLLVSMARLVSAELGLWAAEFAEPAG